ncbi:hypothetical protein [Microbacterium enclense]|uniref:Lipoprotein n=1 Tax=Microbacterium enclense TaxID=993073 RepID=A0A1G6GPF2_9MICO|nr:hypothetical protein [Microbacterium enclense]KSU56425.1 hypothetical protein AS029_01360 [Microbacterium enclense]SDB83880.1 hypothetical protein SAMN05216418_0511 [Microbacterium enclense]
MSRHRLTLIGLLGAGLLAAGALTGCASGAASSSPTSSSSSDAVSPEPAGGVEAAWVDAGRAIAVVTSGSSSCVPSVNGEPQVVDGALVVDLVEPAQEPCTRDMAPRATLVTLPAGTGATADLAVRVSGAVEGETTLAALGDVSSASEDLAPSAGWVTSSLVAIVTYGSSSCVPVVESVTADGDRVAVQFAAPPADQVCTMDYAPRVTLADVGAEAGQGEVSLVLSGGNVQAPDPIPVLGTR